jgi:LPXTG-site transpeptidase (sortase) family protein
MAITVAVAFSPNVRGPISPNQHQGELRAAERVIAMRAAGAPAQGPAPQRLLRDASQIERPGAATRVRLDSLGIDAEVRSVGFVLQGGEIQYDVPRFEAGQYVGTADPGQRGNLVIAGHVANRGAFAVFSRLPEAHIGDTVEVFSGSTMFRYSITELRVVAPDATMVMARTQDATLTLITCSPDINHGRRLIVVGKLI